MDSRRRRVQLVGEMRQMEHQIVRCGAIVERPSPARQDRREDRAAQPLDYSQTEALYDRVSGRAHRHPHIRILSR